jgi:salicylate hydroxylase
MAGRPKGVAVVGAGIAGLATATALTTVGVPVRVYEQAEALGEVGAGISLAPNSLRVFGSFGPADRLSGIESSEPLRMAHYDHRGVRFEDAEVDARGARPVHRADLVGLLSWRLRPGTLRLEARLVGVDDITGWNESVRGCLLHPVLLPLGWAAVRRSPGGALRH